MRQNIVLLTNAKRTFLRVEVWLIHFLGLGLAVWKCFYKYFALVPHHYKNTMRHPETLKK